MSEQELNHLTTAEEIQVKGAVEKFNESPWIDFGTPYDVDKCIERAREIGVDKLLHEIVREDIRLFHKEEAACGNI